MEDRNMPYYNTGDEVYVIKVANNIDLYTKRNRYIIKCRVREKFQVPNPFRSYPMEITVYRIENAEDRHLISDFYDTYGLYPTREAALNDVINLHDKWAI